MKALIGELARFAVVGLGATLTHMTVAWLAHRVGGVPPYWANAMAFAVAFVLSYIGHSRWTFGRGAARRRALPRFFLVALLGYLLSNLVIWVVVDRAGLSFEIALLGILAIVPGTTWLLARLWAFRAIA